MARELKLAVAGLNVRIHPHSPELYDEFIQSLYGLRRPVRLRGDRHAMLTLLDRRDFDSGIIRGLLRTFTKIDPKGQWFDEASLDDANPELLRQIHIPPNAHPNSSSFRFSLNVRTHLLVFEQYSRGRQLTPTSALKLFQTLSDDAEIVRRFNDVKITVLQDRSSLDKIFGLRRLKKITFIIDRPNPDIWSDDIEGQVDAHLAAVHAKQIAVTYTAPPGGSLVETPSLRKLGNGALKNGEVDATGYDESGHVSISTLDSPLVEQTKYNPELETEASAFDRLRRWLEALNQ